MAERRMFAKSIIDSDAFLDMPCTTQSLYFHLCMRADDDGFVSNPKRIQRMLGASDDDLKILLSKRFILAFDSGVIVIKHWRIHNYIRKDTYRETLYSEEKSQLFEKPDGAYTDHAVTAPSRVCDASVDGSLTQDRLGKVSIDKDSKHKHGQYENVLLTDSDFEKLQNEFPTDWLERIERLSEYIASTGKTYKNHLATIRAWAKKDGYVKPKSKRWVQDGDSKEDGHFEYD
jgi:hypothetical protein